MVTINIDKNDEEFLQKEISELKQLITNTVNNASTEFTLFSV